MSLNTSHAPGGHVLIYNGEIILLYTKEVSLTFESNDVTFKGSKKGALYLTSHRIIFINNDGRDRLMSFCMPFHCLREVKLEQPVFGANYLKGQVLAQPGGNWTGQHDFKLTFNRGGCIEFGEALLNAVQLASRYQPYTSPPPYAPPAGGMFSAPPSYYTTSGNQYNGLNIPTETFPEAPPAGSVYMYESPPPYGGIGPVQSQQTPPPPPPGYNSKEAEAFGGQVMGNPPTYNDVVKR